MLFVLFHHTKSFIFRFELYKNYKYIQVKVWCVRRDSVIRERVMAFYNDPFDIDDVTKQYTIISFIFF
jgi:hypothetical protein